MACPRCGNNNRRELAPGLFRCNGGAGDVVAGWVPAPGAGPGVGPTPLVPGPVPGHVCGYEYREAVAGSSSGSMDRCFCGLLAIGFCQAMECGVGFCADHRQKVKDSDGSVVWWCEPCSDNLAKRNRRRREQRRQTRIAELQAIEHLVERVVATLGAFARLELSGGIDGDAYYHRIEVMNTDQDAINEVLPGSIDDGTSWRGVAGLADADVARWFAGAALERGVPTVEHQHQYPVHKRTRLLRRRCLDHWVDGPSRAVWALTAETRVDTEGSLEGPIAGVTLIKMAQVLGYPEAPTRWSIGSPPAPDDEMQGRPHRELR